MHPPTRLAIWLCATLAILTRFAAGALSWGYLDEAQRSGPLFYALYWPLLLVQGLPAHVAVPLQAAALPMVLIYFAGYLLVDQLVRALRAAIARRRGAAAAGKEPA